MGSVTYLKRAYQEEAAVFDRHRSMINEICNADAAGSARLYRQIATPLELIMMYETYLKPLEELIRFHMN